MFGNIALRRLHSEYESSFGKFDNLSICEIEMTKLSVL